MKFVHCLSIGSLVVLASTLLSCKKDPGEGAAAAVEKAGYELTPEAYFRAVESNDLHTLEQMEDAGFDLTTTDPRGRTAMHAAAGRDAIRAIDFLRERDLDINATDRDGRTPLMEAVLLGSPATVRHLLAHGADPQSKDAKHFKPLMLAVREGRADMVEVLAPYVRRDLNDALLAAAILGQTDVIDELTNYGASVYARYEDGRTPLMLAAEYGHTETVEFLLAIGANRFAMDDQGRTAADLATASGHGALASRLSDAPRAEDFELLEPAELGTSLLAETTTDSAPDSTPDVNEAAEAAAPNSDPRPANQSIAPLDGATLQSSIPRPARSAEPQPGARPSPDGTDQPTTPPADAPASATATTAASTSARPDAPSDAATGSSDAPPVVMRAYREKVLPIQIESTRDTGAQIKVAGGPSAWVKPGETIPNTSLELVDIKRRHQSGKTDGGAATDVSVVTLRDTRSEVTRSFTVGLPALAHDPVALIEDTATGEYYLARIGQSFHTANGDRYLVADVRANQIVIEHLATGQTTTLYLRGPRG